MAKKEGNGHGLVLTRRIGETIVIGDNLIRIYVVDIRSKQVRVAIKAPDSLRIDREEIYQAKKRGDR